MANKFAELMNGNEELKAKIRSAQNADVAWEIISENMPNYTKEQFAEDMKEATLASAELSDDQLDAVAGGITTEDIYISDKEFFKTLFDIFDWFK